MEETIKPDELDLDNIPDPDEEEEEEDFSIKGDYQQQLLKAAQKGDYDLVKKCIDKKANILFEDKKKWTALVWAACKGYVAIVRLLISKGAANPFLTQKNEEEKIKMGTINNSSRPNPLQWSCFKCHLNIVWLLLKVGLNWKEIDSFGNNSVHLAASGGSYPIFESLMIWGVEINGKNTRGHEVKDLATNKDILWLIKKYEDLKQCAKCNRKFGENCIKHWCRFCKNFFCEEHCRIEWVYEGKDSVEKEKLDGKCDDCSENINKHTEELKLKMEGYSLKELKEKMDFINDQSIEIDVKLMNDAQILQEKLKTQDSINIFLSGLKVVPNYKTILKTINTINNMLEDAVSRNVILDNSVIDFAKSEVDRLFAERQLRFQLDNLDIYNAKPEEVKTLEDLSNAAKDKKVDGEYLQEADLLTDKMTRSIKAKTIFKNFCDYPLREIPPARRYDPKTKKLLDPVTGKPMDPKKIEPKKKKRKKEPKFVIPEWATESLALEKEIKNLELVLKDKEELRFEEEFLVRCKEKIAYMKEELRYRRELEQDAKELAEKKAAEKKKKK